MKKHLLLFIISLFSLWALAQTPHIVGKAANGTYQLTADTSILRKALEKTLADGTKILSMNIESEGKWHYLVGTGINKGYRKYIAIELEYEMGTRNFVTSETLGHKTCASAGCDSCLLFKENGNIIGCHCTDKKTVSNECNFKKVTPSAFYYELHHYYTIKKRSSPLK